MRRLIGKPLTAVGYGLTAPAATDNEPPLRRFHLWKCHRRARDPRQHRRQGHILRRLRWPSAPTRSPTASPGWWGIHSSPSRLPAAPMASTPASISGTFIHTWLTDKEGGATCVEVECARPAARPPRIPTACALLTECATARAPTCSAIPTVKAASINSLCTALACRTPPRLHRPARLRAHGQPVRLAPVHRRSSRSPSSHCTHSCASAPCATGTSRLGRVPVKPQKPYGGTGPRVRTHHHFCLGGTSCLSVPTGGLRCTKSSTTHRGVPELRPDPPAASASAT